MFEVFEHTADLGIRVEAESLNGLFAGGGRALMSVIAGDLSGVESREAIEIDLEGEAIDYLFFDWLNELLFTFESRRLLLAEFDAALRETSLHAVCRGEPFDPSRHRLEHEVKAITYHDLRVEQQDGRWRAEVIVDI